MTMTITTQLAVCTVSTCGKFFNPSVVGMDRAGRCVGCRMRDNKAAVRIDASACVPGIVREPQQRQVAAPKWADESNGVCNRCAGKGQKFGGDCFRCGGDGVAPGHKAKATAVAAVETFSLADIAEEVVLDLADAPVDGTPYAAPSFREPDEMAQAIAAAERAEKAPKRFRDLAPMQQHIVLQRCRFLVARRGITRFVGSDVIPF